MRIELDLYAGVRPIYLYAAEHTPLKGLEAGDIDFVITEYDYNAGSYTIGLYENVGDLDRFVRREALTLPLGLSGAREVALADVDGDGGK